MLARAEVSAVDTAPEQLRVSTQVGLLPAVAAHRVKVGRHRVELRILAASHQVVVDDVDDPSVLLAVLGAGAPKPANRTSEGLRGDGTRHIETVACELAMPGAEPVVDGRRYEQGRWVVAASVVRLDGDWFAEQAGRWIARGASDERCVVVGFPNHPFALTALALDDGAGELRGWTGVHLYPSSDGSGVVVRTTTEKVLTGVRREELGA